MKEILKKMLQFQQKVGVIIKSEENPYFKSKYASINTILEIIKPVLNECGLVIIQPIVELNGKTALKTIVADADSAETIESIIILPEINDPQKIGSMLTYMRRFALQSICLLQSEDDDGEQAVRIYCARCAKNGRQTVITDTELQSSTISGYKLCKSCFDIYSTQNKNK